MGEDRNEIRDIAERISRMEATLKIISEQYDAVARMTEHVVRLQEKHTSHDGQIEILFEKCRVNDINSSNNSRELNTWVNRGVGAYTVGAVLAGLISFFLLRIVDQYDSQIRTQGELIVTIDRRIAWLEFENKKRENKPDNGISK